MKTNRTLPNKLDELERIQHVLIKHYFPRLPHPERFRDIATLRSYFAIKATSEYGLSLGRAPTIYTEIEVIKLFNDYLKLSPKQISLLSETNPNIVYKKYFKNIFPNNM